jgi:hypothetical protein
MTTFRNNKTTLEIDGNIITVTNGNDHISAIAPIWLAEVLEQNKASQNDITFSDTSTRFIFAAIGKLAHKSPPPVKFEAIMLRLPRQMTLILHDTGLIELCNSTGKRLGYKHTPLVAGQLAKFCQAREMA